MFKVLKFGGSSVGNKNSIMNVTKIIKNNYQNHNKQIVILSAMYGVTNKLNTIIEYNTNKVIVKEIINEIQKQHVNTFYDLVKDLDLTQSYKNGLEKHLYKEFYPIINNQKFNSSSIITIGERLMIDLFFKYNVGDIPLFPITADKIIKTNINGNVNFDETIHLTQKYLTPHINKNFIPLITGFMSSSSEGNVTTLGRGGSDYTATIIGSVMDVDQVELWKLEAKSNENGWMDTAKSDKEQKKWLGITSAPPNLVDDPNHVTNLSYKEANSLKHFGKKVIHPKTIQPLIESNIPLVIKNSSLLNETGTIISSNSSNEKPNIITDQSFDQFLKINNNNLVNPDLVKYKNDYTDVIAIVGAEINDKEKYKTFLTSYCDIRDYDYHDPNTLVGNNNFFSIFTKKEHKKPLVNFIYDEIIKK